MGLVIDNPSTIQETLGHLDSISGSGKSPGAGYGNPLQVLLPRECHGQRSLASP